MGKDVHLKETQEEQKEELKEVKFGQLLNSNNMSRIEIAASMRKKSLKIAEKLIKDQSEWHEQTQHQIYCPICYNNVIDSIFESGSKTVRFEQCSHAFCSDCTLEQLKMWISKGEVDKLKCFDYDCTNEISDDNLRQILT